MPVIKWIKDYKTFFLLIISAVISVILLLYFFSYMISSGMNDGGIYTESDFLKYHALTDSDILNSPRISREYYFEYHPGDGSPLSNAIVFSGSTDVESLKAYLSALGYTLHKRIIARDHIIWESHCTLSQSSSFYLSVNYTENKVKLEKLSCY